GIIGDERPTHAHGDLRVVVGVLIDADRPRVGARLVLSGPVPRLGVALSDVVGGGFGEFVGHQRLRPLECLVSGFVLGGVPAGRRGREFDGCLLVAVAAGGNADGVYVDIVGAHRLQFGSCRRVNGDAWSQARVDVFGDG